MSTIQSYFNHCQRFILNSDDFGGDVGADGDDYDDHGDYDYNDDDHDDHDDYDDYNDDDHDYDEFNPQVMAFYCSIPAREFERFRKVFSRSFMPMMMVMIMVKMLMLI